MRNRLFASSVLALIMMSSAALAGPTYTWNTTGNSSTSGPAGNERTFGAVGNPGEILKVRGYATGNSNGTGNFQDAYVGAYGGGLGVTNSSSGESSSPNHGTDNNGKDDFLLFEFEASNYRATGFTIGWREYNNTDIQVWVGGTNAGAGLDLSSNGLCGGACDKNDLDDLGFTLLPTFLDVDPGETPSINTTVSGRYVLITGLAGAADDYFKLSSISGKQISVPEPTALALALGGLFGIGGIARRTRRA
jgi:hypothetical protein